MSTEQSLDPQLIEQTKQQIRTLVSEIAQLSKSEMAPEEFHGEFLPRVVSALAAIGGVVWSIDGQGRLGLAYQVNLQQTKLHESEENQLRHGRLLQKVLAMPGPGQIVGEDRVLTAFDQRELSVEGRPAIRLETMGDFGVVNHVLVVLDGKRGLVLRGRIAFRFVCHRGFGEVAQSKPRNRNILVNPRWGSMAACSEASKRAPHAPTGGICPG